MNLRFIHVVWIYGFFFKSLKNYSVVSIYNNVFIHYSTEGHLCYFQFWASITFFNLA